MIPKNESTLSEALASLAVSRKDETAWEKLYRLTWPFVHAIVYRRLGGIQDLAEDATQEVFIRLLRSCPFSKLQLTDAFRGYLWRVSDNVARTYRQRIIAQREVAVLNEGTTLAKDAGSGISDDMELEQLLRDVWRGLNKPERHVLRLLIEGCSTKEIADHLGLSYGAAAIRLMRLRRKLRKSLVFKGLLTT